jgi:hypothetical protein
MEGMEDIEVVVTEEDIGVVDTVMEEVVTVMDMEEESSESMDKKLTQIRFFTQYPM